MHIPSSRERVRLHGRPGTYFVLSVDREMNCAEMVRVDENDTPVLEEFVPFSEIQALEDAVHSA